MDEDTSADPPAAVERDWGGAPSKISAERIDELERYVRGGNFMAVAARASAIHPDTLARWIARGQRALDAALEDVEAGGPGEIPESERLYAECAARITVARAESEVRAVARVQLAARDDWKAAAWWLERSFPDRYGSHQTLRHTGDSSQPVAVVPVEPGSVSRRVAHTLAALGEAGVLPEGVIELLAIDDDDDAEIEDAEIEEER